MEGGWNMALQPPPGLKLTACQAQDAFTVSIPCTSCMTRSTTKEAWALIKSVSESACKLCTLIEQLDKSLQKSIIEKEIGNHVHQKFQESAAKMVHANFCDRKRLTNAKVITTKDAIGLREAREFADTKKVVKAATRKEKKNLKEL